MDVLLATLAVVVHLATCAIGHQLGAERGRGGLGLLLAFLFSVLGLIVIVGIPTPARHVEPPRVPPDPNLADVAKNTADLVLLLDQASAQLARIEKTGVATARLAGIVARVAEGRDVDEDG